MGNEEMNLDKTDEMPVVVQELNRKILELTEQIQVLERERLDIREAFDELKTLQVLSEAISSAHDQRHIIDLLLFLTKNLIKYKSCAVFLLNEKTNQFEPIMMKDISAKLEVSIKQQIEEGIIDWVIKEAKPTIIPDIDADGIGDDDQGGEYSFIVIPLIVSNKGVGVFNIYAYIDRKSFTQHHLDLLFLLSSQAAVAVENAKLYQTINNEKKKVEIILQSLAEGLMTVNKNWTITSFNKMAENITGFSIDEAIGMKCYEVLNSSICNTTQCTIRRASELNKSVVNIEMDIYDKDNKKIPILSSASLLKEENGAIIGGVESLKDITEMKKMNEKLQYLSEYNQNILSSMTSGVMVVDLDFKITTLNKEAENILSMSAIDLLGKPLYEVQGLIEINNMIARMLAAGPDGEHIFSHQEITVVSLDKKKIPLGISTAILRDEAKNIQGSIAVFRDISEIKELRETVERNNRLASLGEMAAGVAHEIRNPLSSIAGFVDLMDEEMKEDNPHKQYTQIILAEIDRLNKVISSIMDFARQVKPLLKEVDINLLLRERLFQLNQDLDKNNIKLELVLDDKLSLMNADPEQLSQVFLNLIQNAIHSMDDGGLLKVSTKFINKDSERDSIKIEIEDTGCGIPKEIIPKIFDPFFTTKRHRGTGLGLSITNRIIVDHRGSINVASEVGKGTKFILSLPTDIIK
ncbi:MAG: ATP-binding protein [bacterium]